MSNFLQIMHDYTHNQFFRNPTALNYFNFVLFEFLGIDFDENQYEFF